VHQQVMEDPSLIPVLRAACARDPIFFVDTFLWTYDPRREDDGYEGGKLPFVLYPFQEDALLEILDAINHHDLLIDKSRDMGASCLCLAAIFFRWLFRSRQSCLVGSRVDEYVDQTDNPKSLFWKLDFYLDGLPYWLRPRGFDSERHRIKRHLLNPENHSVIDGETTTSNFGRGDRRTVIMLDEFAAVDPLVGYEILSSTRDATNCRLFNSTPGRNSGNAHYAMTKRPIRKLRLHWTLHPLKRTGLYTTDERGRLKILEEAGYPEGYKPILDGKTRSPWYDEQCKRASSQSEIARELDIDHGGAAGQFFNPDAIQKKIEECTYSPMLVGELVYDVVTGDPIEFRKDGIGKLRLWCMLNRDGMPICEHRVVIGGDISTGTGASNSCLVVYDEVTLEKLAEYASPYIRPEALAVLAVALARWFKQATRRTPFLIWESNGPGRQFGDKVVDLGYGNIYLRRKDASIKRKVSDIPGWASTKETKLVLLGQYRSAVEHGRIINRSKLALEETLEYVWLPNGTVSHTRSTDREDPSGSNDNHGDRVIADALAYKGIGRYALKIEEESPKIPVGSLAWRRNRKEESNRRPGRYLTEGWR